MATDPPGEGDEHVPPIDLVGARSVAPPEAPVTEMPASGSKLGLVELSGARDATPQMAPVTAPDSGTNMSSVELSGARDATPQRAPVRRTPMSELEQAAVWLAGGVLAMILSVMVIVLIAAAAGEFSSAQAEIASLQKMLDIATQSYLADKTPEALERANQLAQRIRDLRQDARKLWFDFAQLLLVNVLLPVLTSILGYVFGTMRATKPEAQ